MSILVAVPTYPPQIKSNCVLSLLTTQRMLLAEGHKVQAMVTTIGDISIARNVVGSMMLYMEHSHVLFVDSDMEFPEAAVLQMLNADVPLIGAIYRKRSEQVQWAITRLPDEKSFEVKSGICRLAGIGMGVCLIRRDVFLTLQNTGTLRKSEKRDFGLKGPLYGFFDPIVQANGEIINEDMAFCDRWRRCGGEVFGLADKNIGHIGEFTYSGTYIDHLKR